MPYGDGQTVPQLNKGFFDKHFWVTKNQGMVGWEWMVNYITPPEEALKLGFPRANVYWRNAFKYQEWGRYGVLMSV